MKIYGSKRMAIDRRTTSVSYEEYGPTNAYMIAVSQGDQANGNGSLV